MKNFILLFRNIISKNISDLKYLLLIALTSSLYFFINRPWGHEILNFKTKIDDMIPIIPISVLIYNIWFPSLILILIYICHKDKKLYYKSVFSLFLSDTVCLITYLLFQNEVIREPITSKGIFSSLLEFTRMHDNPYNGFPSMHIVACFILIFSLIRFNISKQYKAILIILNILIIISTFTTKQHYVLDGVGAFIITIIIYPLVSIICEKKNFPN